MKYYLRYQWRYRKVTILLKNLLYLHYIFIKKSNLIKTLSETNIMKFKTFVLKVIKGHIRPFYLDLDFFKTLYKCFFPINTKFSKSLIGHWRSLLFWHRNYLTLKTSCGLNLIFKRWSYYENMIVYPSVILWVKDSNLKESK